MPPTAATASRACVTGCARSAAPSRWPPSPAAAPRSARRCPDDPRAAGRRSSRGPGRAARVLILTTYETDADILRAVEAGAAGYLLKDATPAELADAVRAAARGDTVL